MACKQCPALVHSQRRIVRTNVKSSANLCSRDRNAPRFGLVSAEHRKGGSMNSRRMTSIDVRRLVFPLIAGSDTSAGFKRAGLAGTGFFISSRGLALTAAHVIRDLKAEVQVRAALPQAFGPMKAFKLEWVVYLPGSDIAVIRVNVPDSACFITRFEIPFVGESVETTAIPNSMLEMDDSGRTTIRMKCAKGYVAYDLPNGIAASFPLPKGMSGAPVIATNEKTQRVVGVFVGQNRGEELEDQVTEVINESSVAQSVHIERVSRVEYTARGDLFARFRTHVATEFNGATLEELIKSETPAAINAKRGARVRKKASF